MYIIGQAVSLTSSPATISNTGSDTYQENDADATSLSSKSPELRGYGLSYEDGEILAYFTELTSSTALMTGIGKADNLYFVPKINLIASFQVDNIQLIARF